MGFRVGNVICASRDGTTHDELLKGATDTHNVLNYGMGYDLRRFSTLTQINKDTVKRLVPLWNYSFDDNRSEESQPLVYKGVIYITTNNATMAVDAKMASRSGKRRSNTRRRRHASLAAILSTAALLFMTARSFAQRSTPM